MNNFLSFVNISIKKKIYKLGLPFYNIFLFFFNSNYENIKIISILKTQIKSYDTFYL